MTGRAKRREPQTPTVILPNVHGQKVNRAYRRRAEMYRRRAKSIGSKQEVHEKR